MVNHTWHYCSHCGYTMVICGTCRNNTCNGGYGKGKTDEEDCPDCPSAYELCKKDFEKHNSVLWLNTKYIIKLTIRRISNFIYYWTHSNFRKTDREWRKKNEV